ncbi:MAG: SAM-dependent methyltransferase [Dehalococcoidia bacterium]|nr:SAM-dependent methyltransferase [Dehalococcoidia bacterium]
MGHSDLGATHNVLLRDIISQHISHTGPITFSDFMALALYHPDQGYYVRCDPSLDYHSSPNVHPVFGATIARQLAGFWRQLGEPSRFDVFEAGAGNGRLASDILRHLRLAEPALYEAIGYTLQDATYRQTEAVNFIDAAGLPADKVMVASGLPETDTIEGCILSNELLDALPFHRVRRRDGRLYEVRVGYQHDRFVDAEVDAGPKIDAYFTALGIEPGEGCDAEVCLAASEWIGAAARALRRGHLLTLDYGYEASALYAPWRKAGTLLTFYRHTSGDDPYARVGRQDITASVDFTTVMRAGEASGLRTLGLTTQAEYLGALGIGEGLTRRPAADGLEAYYALRRSVIELTDPSGLGRIRVLLQAKDVPEISAVAAAG